MKAKTTNSSGGLARPLLLGGTLLLLLKLVGSAVTIVRPERVAAAPEAPPSAGTAPAAGPVLFRSGRVAAAPLDEKAIASYRDATDAGWSRARLKRSKKGRPFQVGVRLTADCDRGAFSEAVKRANKSGEEILFELRPIACTGLALARKSLDARDFSRGAIKLGVRPPSGNAACTVSFESCVAPKGVESCEREARLFSVPIVFKNGFVHSLDGVAAVKATDDPDAAEAATKALGIELSSKERAATLRAVLRSQPPISLRLDGVRLEVPLRYDSQSACGSGTNIATKKTKAH